MDFLIKIGETGKSFPYTNILPAEKILYLQEKIRNDTKIELKDQILLTKKGFKLYSDDIVSSLETENALQTTLHQENPLKNLKQYYTIYVFNERIINSNGSELYYREQNKENLIREFLENPDISENFLVSAKIIEKDFPRSFEKDFPLEKEKLKDLNSDIFVIEELLFNHYQTIKKKFIEFYIRIKKVDKLINECENQMQSFDVILKETSQYYQSAKLKKLELQKRIKENLEKNSLTVKKFEESIENLKMIEIHEKLRTEKINVLLDIYYNPDSMFNWKQSCITTQTNLKVKTDRIVSYLKIYKKKIKEERNTTIANAINNYKTQKITFEAFSHETESIMLSLFTEIYEDYKNLRVNMEHLSAENENSNTQLFFLSNLDNISGKIDHYNEQISLCNENNEKLIKNFENVLRTKANLEQLIISEYKIMHKYINELFIVDSEKIKILNEEIDKMEKDFAYLLSPLSLPGAYNASLVEVSRRREFAQVIEKKIDKLKKVNETEKEKRKKFLTEYGKILPNEFIPQLKMLPNLTLSLESHDNDLPKIEGYHLEADSYLNKDKSNKMKPLEKHTSDSERVKEEIKEKFKKNDFKRSRFKLINKFLNITFYRNGKSVEDFEQSSIKIFDSFDFEYLHHQIQDLNSKISCLSKDALNPLDLNPKIHTKSLNLTEILQQSSKIMYITYMNRLNEKQQEIENIKYNYEHKLLTIEDEFLNEKNKLIFEYEDQIHSFNLKKNDFESQLVEKTDENEKLRKEMKIKTDLLKLNEEKIKSLNEIKNSLSKEINDFKEKITLYEKKIKVEHSDVLSKIHDIHKIEIEKLKNKVKNCETEVGNKNIELEKANKQMCDLEREVRAKNEEIDRLNQENNNFSQGSQKNREDLQKYVLKIENLEIVVANKTSEIQNQIKNNKELNFEKNNLINENSIQKHQLNDFKSKNQKLLDSFRILELEKENLKNKVNKLTIELEKRTLETQTLQKNIESINSQQIALTDSHTLEKGRISELSEEVAKKKIELTVYQTKIDLLEAEVENKDEELDFIRKELRSLKEENKELKREIEGWETEGERLRGVNGELSQNLEDVRVLNEHLQVEVSLEEGNLKEMKERCSELSGKLDENAGLIASLEERLNKEKKDYEINMVTSGKEIDGLIQRVNELKNLNGNLGEEVGRMKGIERELRKAVEEIEGERNGLVDQLAKRNQLLQTINNNEIQSQEIIKKLTEQDSLNKKEICDLKEELADLKEELAKHKTIEYLKAIESKPEIISEDKLCQMDVEIQTTEEEKLIQNEDLIIFKNEDLTQVKKKEQNDFKETMITTTFEKEEMSCEFSKMDENTLKTNKRFQDFFNSQLSHMDLIEFTNLTIGMKYAFVPAAQGVYVPLILKQNTSLNDMSMEAFGTEESHYKAYKNNYFLDLENMDFKFRELISECSLILIGKVKKIIQMTNYSEMNSFNLKSNEMYYNVVIESPEFIVGFEGDDLSIKNYVV